MMSIREHSSYCILQIKGFGRGRLNYETLIVDELFNKLKSTESDH